MPIDKELRQLAALSYGEASTKNNYEEISAIANIFVRQRDARGYISICDFVTKDPNFSYAANDGNKRYKKMMIASEEAIIGDKGMNLALDGAKNALNSNGKDFSNGAYFWDGADIKTNYKHHPKLKQGIRFSEIEHNIYDIKETTKTVVVYLKVKNKAGQLVNAKELGTYDYIYESTAAYGGTIFWKYNPDFIRISKAKEYK